MKRRIQSLAFAAITALMLAGCESPTMPLSEESALAEEAGATATASKAAQHYTSVVRVHASRNPATPIVPGAQATLVTNDAGATMTIHTSELIPGHAYTVWWVVVNKPENCATSPCAAADILFNTAAVEADVTYAAGHVVGESGKAGFGGHLSAGALPEGWFGNGFTNPRGAEIHVILNDHGPKIPGLVSNQISTYRGGCTDESLPPPFPATAKADGILGPNACQLFQFAIFEQI